MEYIQSAERGIQALGGGTQSFGLGRIIGMPDIEVITLPVSSIFNTGKSPVNLANLEPSKVIDQ